VEDLGYFVPLDDHFLEDLGVDILLVYHLGDDVLVDYIWDDLDGDMF